MPQLQINQGPQDALIFDNSVSYFTNVGYTRTSNFQMELKDADPQNTAALGTTVHYVINKAADLLGPVDLVVKIKPPADLSSKVFKAGGAGFAAWVDELGYALIEKATFSIGSNDIETITGEQMQIKNELMTVDETRLGFNHIMKTGVEQYFPGKRAGHHYTPGSVNKDYTRLIATQQDKAATTETSGERDLIVPLKFFFTNHVSQYFPLAAVAGCNDVRISIKFRPLTQLVQIYAELGGVRDVNPDIRVQDLWGNNEVINSCKIRCHYYHVTSPEAQVLQNKEHMRMLKLWQHQHQNFENVSTGRFDMDLSFLHPVVELLITIRRQEDIEGSNQGRNSGYYFYHGDGTPPNYDDPFGTLFSKAGDYDTRETLKVNSVSLTLNGQERHPGMDKGIDMHYLRHRLTNELHSNSNALEEHVLANTSQTADGFSHTNWQPIGIMQASSGSGNTTTTSGVTYGSANFMQMPNNSATGVADTTDVFCLIVNAGALDLQLEDGMAIGFERDIYSRTAPYPDTADDDLIAADGANFGTRSDDPVLKAGKLYIVELIPGVAGTSGVNTFIKAVFRLYTLEQGAGGSYRKGRKVTYAAGSHMYLDPNVTPDMGAVNQSNGGYNAKVYVPPPNRQSKRTDRIRYAQKGSKNIIVYPFSLNPEGANPSGSVNFSKVSHAKLSLHLEKPPANSYDVESQPLNPAASGWRVDVYAIYYNWLQIKDGRALLSFA